MPVPAVLTYVPATHVVHGVQLAASFVVLKVPLAQPAHARSLDAVPALATYCPAEQLAHGTHAVVSSASWSQVPTSQGGGGEPAGGLSLHAESTSSAQCSAKARSGVRESVKDDEVPSGMGVPTTTANGDLGMTLLDGMRGRIVADSCRILRAGVRGRASSPRRTRQYTKGISTFRSFG